MPADYYKLLGVSREVTATELRIAYYNLVKRIHPDRFSPNTAEWINGNRVFCELNQAYSVLKDTYKRRNYDAVLKDDFNKEAQRENNQESNTTQKPPPPPPTQPSTGTSRNADPWATDFRYNPNEWIDGSEIEEDSDQKGFQFSSWMYTIIVFFIFILILSAVSASETKTKSARYQTRSPALTKPLSDKEWNKIWHENDYRLFTKNNTQSKNTTRGVRDIMTQEPESLKQEIALWTIQAQTPPNSARYSNAIGRKGEAPLKIETNGTGYYFIKLVEIGTNKAVKIFVHAGKPLEVEIPLGKYEMRYAYGNTWYGEEHLFGPETVYSKSDSTFDFYKTGNRLSGYTVTLYEVLNGNMRTREITAADF